MTPTYHVELADCRDYLRTLPDASVDSVVCDPPYELGFMGKAWDSTGIAYDVAVWAECLRVLKPGGHLIAFGGSRTYHRLACAVEDAGFEIRDQVLYLYGSGFPKNIRTQLKPAHEPAVLARNGKLATPLQIGGCRVGTETFGWGGNGSNGFSGSLNHNEAGGRPIAGRHPANLIHDGSPDVRNVLGKQARYFYTAKASAEDRDEGLKGPTRPAGALSGSADGSLNRLIPMRRNFHPTVKPTDLMRYLCRLVTPPGGTVLDPFTGSGSTGKAAMLEGFSFLGSELQPEYHEIALARIKRAQWEYLESKRQLQLFPPNT